MRILLFDIDGTLLSTGGAGMAALKAAMREEFGVADPQEVPVSGRTDRGIARSLFQAHAMDDTEHHWERFRDAYLRHLAEQLPQRTGRVLPGVSTLLDRVAGRPEVQVGLLTGNVWEGARLKLEHYRLMSYFAFGGFGDRHADRDAVAAEALEQGRRRTAGASAELQVWVVGDTPMDVTCARHIGARSIAVATGSFSREVLETYEPDVLVDDLSDAERLADMMLA
ncbi:MAG: HAD hydrolase-like protein [Pirellulales bacterium]